MSIFRESLQLLKQPSNNNKLIRGYKHYITKIKLWQWRIVLGTQG